MSVVAIEDFHPSFLRCPVCGLGFTAAICEDEIALWCKPCSLTTDTRTAEVIPIFGIEAT